MHSLLDECVDAAPVETLRPARQDVVCVAEVAREHRRRKRERLIAAIGRFGTMLCGHCTIIAATRLRIRRSLPA